MTSEVQLENFEKICRTCLKLTENLISISMFNIEKMMTLCTSVQIISPDDELPKNICDLCLTQLQNAYNFKHLCENSERELRQLLENEKRKCLPIFTEKISSTILVENIKPETDYCEQSEDDVIKDGSSDTSDFEESAFMNQQQKKTNEDGNSKVKKQKKYQCEICNHKITEIWQLGIHMKRIHNAEGTKCSHCSFICYHKLHLDAHEKSHIEKKFVCDVCKTGFISQVRLRKHKVSHSNERPYSCSQCDLSFKLRFCLTNHIKKVHAVQTFEMCQVCGKNVRKIYLDRHLKAHKERSLFPCSECSKQFSLKQSLENHFKRVHKNEAIKYTCLCNICGQGVVSRAELLRHVRSHTGEKPFACDKCNKRFRRTGALNFHIKTVHLDQRPCICSICSKAFHSKNTLQNHMRKHTGERPFSCLICGKAFGFRGVLKKHMKVHAT